MQEKLDDIEKAREILGQAFEAENDKLKEERDEAISKLAEKEKDFQFLKEEHEKLIKSHEKLKTEIKILKEEVDALKNEN